MKGAETGRKSERGREHVAEWDSAFVFNHAVLRETVVEKKRSGVPCRPNWDLRMPE